MPMLNVNLIIAWDGTNWDDESEYLVTASGNFSLRAPGDFLVAGSGNVDQAVINLASINGRYVSYLDNYEFYQKHVRLEVSLDGGDFARVFSGAIDRAELSAPNATNVSMLTLHCTTQEGPYLQRKFNLPMSTFRELASSPVTETEWFNILYNGASIPNPLTRVFDPGLVTIPWLWADDESALEECWAAAAACGGVFYSNLLGHSVYRNASWVAKNISDIKETFARDPVGAEVTYVSAEIDYNQDNLYADVTVEVSSRQINEPELVWSPEDYERLIVPAEGELKVIATYDDPVYEILSFDWEATTEMGTPFNPAELSVVRTDYAQKSELVFTNTHDYEPALIRYFRITGQPVTGRTTFEFKAASSEAYWNDKDRRTRSVRSNVYIQTPAQGQFVADIVLAESQLPRPIIRLNGVPGKQSRFIGDTVRIRDTRMRTALITGQIIALGWQIGTTYQHTVTVHDYGSVYSAAPYFILNTDTVGGARKIFY